jgi:hypothetical protein
VRKMEEERTKSNAATTTTCEGRLRNRFESNTFNH